MRMQRAGASEVGIRFVGSTPTLARFFFSTQGRVQLEVQVQVQVQVP